MIDLKLPPPPLTLLTADDLIAESVKEAIEAAVPDLEYEAAEALDRSRESYIAAIQPPAIERKGFVIHGELSLDGFLATAVEAGWAGGRIRRGTATWIHPGIEPRDLFGEIEGDVLADAVDRISDKFEGGG